MPQTPLPEALDRVRAELLSAARRQQRAGQGRRPRRLPPRLLAIGTVALVAAGTATAAVLAPSGTTDLETAAQSSTPAAESLKALWSKAWGSGGSSAIRTPLSGDSVKGLTVTREGISAEVATDGQQVCFADHITQDPIGNSGCTNVPISTRALPYTIGDDETRTWVVAIVPDGVTGLEATGVNGQVDLARVENNVGIMILPAPGGVRELRWTTPDGDRVQQEPFRKAEVTPGGVQAQRTAPPTGSPLRVVTGEQWQPAPLNGQKPAQSPNTNPPAIAAPYGPPPTSIGKPLSQEALLAALPSLKSPVSIPAGAQGADLINAQLSPDPGFDTLGPSGISFAARYFGEFQFRGDQLSVTVWQPSPRARTYALVVGETKTRTPNGAIAYVARANGENRQAATLQVYEQTIISVSGGSIRDRGSLLDRLRYTR